MTSILNHEITRHTKQQELLNVSHKKKKKCKIV